MESNKSCGKRKEMVFVIGFIWVTLPTQLFSSQRIQMNHAFRSFEHSLRPGERRYKLAMYIQVEFDYHTALITTTRGDQHAPYP